EPEEVLAGITFPVWDGRCGFAVKEMARRAGDFAVAGAAVGVELDGDDRITRCAIGLIGVGSTPERGSAAEAVAVGQAVGVVDVDEVGRAATASLENITSDLHGTADYRRKVGAVMVARALRSAIEEASNG